MTETLAPTTTYCTLARIGYWASLDAKCETSAPDEYGILSHDISFVLIAQFGDRVFMGFRIIKCGDPGSCGQASDDHADARPACFEPASA